MAFLEQFAHYFLQTSVSTKLNQRAAKSAVSSLLTGEISNLSGRWASIVLASVGIAASEALNVWVALILRESCFLFALPHQKVTLIPSAVKFPICNAGCRAHQKIFVQFQFNSSIDLWKDSSVSSSANLGCFRTCIERSELIIIHPCPRNFKRLVESMRPNQEIVEFLGRAEHLWKYS